MHSYRGEEFGKRLEDAIDRAHLRQSEVADRCGIHRSDLSRAIKGERGLNSKQLAAVGGLLGVSVEFLTAGAKGYRGIETPPGPVENVRPEAQNLPARVQAARDDYLGRHQHELSLAEARWIERCTPWIEEDDGVYDDDFWSQMLAAYRTAHLRSRR